MLPAGTRPCPPAAPARRPRRGRAWYSTLPSFRPRSPIVTRCGMPISSRSANMHAGPLVAIVEQDVDAGRAQLGVQLVGRRAHRVAASIADRARSPLRTAPSRGPDDAALVVVLLDRGGDDARDADAVAAHLHRAATGRFVEVSWRPSPRNNGCRSWKTWPTSMPRTISSVPLPSGDGSPATTLRRSATLSGSRQSRPKLTPRRWKPASFAPQTKSLIAATVRSAIERHVRRMPTGPREPGRAAGRRDDLGLGRPSASRRGPAACSTLISFSMWSPRSSSMCTPLVGRAARCT